jgi:hypothetical protein
MSCRIFRFCSILLIIGWVATAIPAAQGNEALALSGSYAVQSQADSGGQVQVTLQIRLSNHGLHDLHIQRMTLWDFSHPAKGATQACSILLHAGSSSNSTQKFTVPRAEYELWKRGSRPRMVLELGTGNGRPGTAVVRLDQLSGGKASRP